MNIDYFYILCLAIFLLGIWFYFKKSLNKKDINKQQRQGLFLIIMAIIFAIIYYYNNNTIIVKANMNGNDLENCKAQLKLCSTQYADKITQANNLWRDHQILLEQYNKLSNEYQSRLGNAPNILVDPVDELSASVQSAFLY